MTTTSSYPTDPYRRRPALTRRFLPLALITLGVVFLLGNLIPQGSRHGLILFGLGAAFLIGRLTTGRYGYAVPAGLLLAIGTYLTLQDSQGPRQMQGGGWFFVLLGLGFGLVYLIGLRPSAVWPLFPATVLLGLALVLFGVASLGALASLSWIVAYWPMALVLLGLWLLFRDHLPAPLRPPIATLGGLALLGYGILAAAASVATGGALARTDLAASFGSSPFAETVTLEVPIADGQTFSVDNPNGSTTVHAGTGSNVHVVATKHYSVGGEAPDVRLTPDGSGVNLSVSNPSRGFPFGGSNSWVEYAIEVPAAVQVNASSGSGQIDVDGITGAVQAKTSSGALSLMNLGGSTQAQSSSGSIDLSNLAGDVKVSTSSGQIRATEVRHLREAKSSSGSISLEGIFTDAASIQANSGSANVKLLPGSAVQLDVKTGSGSVNPQGLVDLQGGSTQQHRLTGTIGTPAAGAILAIETSSGSVQISE
jgi:Putative adhesin